MKSGIRSWLAAGRLIALVLVGALIPAHVKAQTPDRDVIGLDWISIDESIARQVQRTVRTPSDSGGRSVARTSSAVRQPRRSAVPWAILGGAVAGLAVSGSAAATRGENEGGGFCTPCFLRWSAVTLPVGAAVGALTGYLIDVSRR